MNLSSVCCRGQSNQIKVNPIDDSFEMKFIMNLCAITMIDDISIWICRWIGVRRWPCCFTWYPARISHTVWIKYLFWSFEAHRFETKQVLPMYAFICHMHLLLWMLPKWLCAVSFMHLPLSWMTVIAIYNSEWLFSMSKMWKWPPGYYYQLDYH